MQRATNPPLPEALGNPDAFGNAPPYSLEAEQAFLGALLLWNHVLEDVPSLAPEHFFDPMHAHVFTIARDLLRQGRRADALSIAPALANLPPVDGQATPVHYLGTLGVRATTPGAAKDTARTIIDLADRRQLMLIGEDLIASAREANPDFPPKALIEETEARLYSLAEYNQGQEATTLGFGEAMAQAVDHAYAAYRGERTGLKTGLVDLDAKLGGMQATDLIIVAGRPGMGKTACCTNIAFHVAQTQCPVHFFSLEMSAQQLAMRVLAEQIEVPSHRLRSGRANEAQLKSMMAKAHALAELPLFTDELGGASIAQVAARARRLKRKRNTGLIVVDYLQLMQAGRRRDGNRVQDITEITTGLKALAKELHVPIIAVSQLSRATEQRENKRPQLSDLRESGSIEQDGDVVMFTFREEYYVERDQPSETDLAAYQEWQDKLRAVAGKAEIIVGKHRHGELGSVQVAFSGEFTRFSNLAKQGDARG